MALARARLALALALVLLSAPETASAGGWHRTWSTWYGPGFYNNRTACGQKLTSPFGPGKGLRGVAMPVGVGYCGKRITLRAHGRIVRTRIIDRCGCARNSVIDMTAQTAWDLYGHGNQHSGWVRWRWGG